MKKFIVLLLPLAVNGMQPKVLQRPQPCPNESFEIVGMLQNIEQRLDVLQNALMTSTIQPVGSQQMNEPQMQRDAPVSSMMQSQNMTPIQQERAMQSPIQQGMPPMSQQPNMMQSFDQREMQPTDFQVQQQNAIASQQQNMNFLQQTQSMGPQLMQQCRSAPIEHLSTPVPLKQQDIGSPQSLMSQQQTVMGQQASINPQVQQVLRHPTPHPAPIQMSPPIQQQPSITPIPTPSNYEAAPAIPPPIPLTNPPTLPSLTSPEPEQAEHIQDKQMQELKSLIDVLKDVVKTLRHQKCLTDSTTKNSPTTTDQSPMAAPTVRDPIVGGNQSFENILKSF